VDSANIHVGKGNKPPTGTTKGQNNETRNKSTSPPRKLQRTNRYSGKNQRLGNGCWVFPQRSKPKSNNKQIELAQIKS